jgi:plasmid stability protein
MIAQMTLRQIPDSVEKKLRARSKQSRQSINRTAIELLEEALGVKASAGKKRDLSALAGTWQKAECKEFERNTAIFGKIDKELWAS